MSSPTTLAQCIADSIRLIESLAKIDGDKAERILAKAQMRHAKLLVKYLEIDPNMEAMHANSDLTSDATEMYNHANQLISQYSAGSIDASRLDDLRALSFAVVCNGSNLDTLVSYSMVTVAAAYRIGVRDGMETKVKFQVIPTNVRMGTD